MHPAIELVSLRAEVERLKGELRTSIDEKIANGEDAINTASELHHLREGVRGFALTLRDWAVRAGGHTPSAIIASRLLELIGDEKIVLTEADLTMNADGTLR